LNVLVQLDEEVTVVMNEKAQLGTAKQALGNKTLKRKFHTLIGFGYGQ
jgi:hypothetical protein